MPRCGAMLAWTLILALGAHASGETPEEALLLQAQQHHRQMPAYGQAPVVPPRALVNQQQEQQYIQPRVRSQIEGDTEHKTGTTVEQASATAMVADVAAKEASEEQAKAEEDYAMAADAARSMPTNEVLAQELEENNYKAQVANERATQMKERAKVSVQAISVKENIAAQAKEHVTQLTQQWDMQEKNLTSRLDRAKLEAQEKANVAAQMRQEEEEQLNMKWAKINKSLEQSWADIKRDMNNEARRVTRQRHMEITMAVARAREATNATSVSKAEALRMVDESNRADVLANQATQSLAEVKQRKEEKFAVEGMAQELRVAKAAAAAKAETEALKVAQAKSVLTAAETQARHSAGRPIEHSPPAAGSALGAATAGAWTAHEAPAQDSSSGVWHGWRWGDSGAPATQEAQEAKTNIQWTWPQ